MPNNNLPSMSLSHIELYVQDLAKMEQFYTQNLSMLVTDRGEGNQGMVFLSRSPEEHHQIVLNPGKSHRTIESPIDHIAFRVSNISDLRKLNASLQLNSEIKIQAVSHGTAWSIYFRDPENNRFEIFCDTPWYVNQPCKFSVDITKTDEELIEFTKNKIKDMPGFTDATAWHNDHRDKIG